MITKKTKQVFVASDNTEHDSREKAQQHDMEIMLNECKCWDDPIAMTDYCNELAEYLLNNSDKVIEILVVDGRRARKARGKKAKVNKVMAKVDEAIDGIKAMKPE